MILPLAIKPLFFLGFMAGTTGLEPPGPLLPLTGVSADGGNSGQSLSGPCFVQFPGNLGEPGLGFSFHGPTYTGYRLIRLPRTWAVPSVLLPLEYSGTGLALRPGRWTPISPLIW